MMPTKVRVLDLAKLTTRTDCRIHFTIAVDGCKDGSDEPGALEFDWLEVQLDSFRERGMQVRVLSLALA